MGKIGTMKQEESLKVNTKLELFCFYFTSINTLNVLLVIINFFFFYLKCKNQNKKKRSWTKNKSDSRHPYNVKRRKQNLKNNLKSKKRKKNQSATFG